MSTIENLRYVALTEAAGFLGRTARRTALRADPTRLRRRGNAQPFQSTNTQGGRRVTPHMVRYTVKADQAAHNEELVRAIFAELAAAQPPGLRYAAFRLADGVTFIHLISHDPTEGHRPPPRLEALKAFHAGLRERCDEAPVRAALTEIGSYHLFGDA